MHDVSKGKFGGSLGVFAQIPLVQNDIFDSAFMYLEPSLEFNTQGETAEAPPFETQKFNNNYVSAAVYLKYFFHKGNMKRDLFLFGGPRIEYLVSDSKTTTPSYEAAYYQYNLDSKINKFGYGVTVGAGLAIGQQWEMYLRYDRGFSKVYPDNPGNTYNRLLGLGFNYYISSNW